MNARTRWPLPSVPNSAPIPGREPAPPPRKIEFDPKMTWDDLCAIAETYEVDPRALLIVKGDIDLARKLTEAWDILNRMTPDQAKMWLAEGERLRKH